MILAGGRAGRMGGGDKVLLRLDGRTLLSILIARMAPQCSHLALSANGDPARFADFALPIVADPIGPSMGPLAGVLAGLDRLVGQSETAWLLTVPGDTPFVPANLALRLHEAATRNGVAVAHARSGDRDHPLVALWSTAVRERLNAAMGAAGVRKVSAFQASVRSVAVEGPLGDSDPFFNVNTPEDLEKARTQ